MTNPIQPPGTVSWSLDDPSYQQWSTASTGIFGQNAPQAVHAAPSPSGWTEKPGSYYFEDDVDCIHRFQDHRATRKLMNAQANVHPIWSEEQELVLVEKVWRHFHDHPWPGVASWSHPDLDLDKLPSQSLRKYPLQPFKIEYQTYQEIRLRLYNTVIGVKGNPFWVTQIANTPQGWKLALWDGDKVYQVMYKDLQDLRSFPPMYINTGHTGWLCRHPGRVYQQGLNRHNTTLRNIEGNSGLMNFDPSGFISGFRRRTNRQWKKEFHELMEGGEMNNIRLSDEIAVTVKKDNVLACYKGRALGHIQGSEITVLDEDDLLQEWIEKSARQVGLELRGE
jgi:hypothetical protein